jgi:hypothetical protein
MFNVAAGFSLRKLKLAATLKATSLNAPVLNLLAES